MSIVEDNLTLIAYVDKDIESELHARFDIKGYTENGSTYQIAI